jgi:transcriptional regulator with XRE-family HTH domain
MSRREIDPPQFNANEFNDLTPEQQALAVAWNLRQLRKRARLSGRALAELLARRCPEQAVGITMLGEIERGRRRMSLALALALARTLRIDPRALFVVPERSVNPLSPDSMQWAAAVMAEQEGDTADAPADAA